jgi:hypothetical protein
MYTAALKSALPYEGPKSFPLNTAPSKLALENRRIDGKGKAVLVRSYIRR